MRYFLMVVGLLAGAGGLFGYASESRDYEPPLCLALFVAATVFFAAGAATVDIVEQIKEGQRGRGKDNAPTAAKAQEQDT